MGETTGECQVWTHGFPVPGRTAELARQAEESGFGGLLLADSQNLVGDPLVELGVAAGVTHRIGLGTGIVNLITRHPAVVAAAIATVQVESGGRAVLGVGRGDSSLAQIGLAAPPLARLRDLVAQVRGYLRGEEVKAGGTASRIGWIAETGLPAVPVELAATGPRTIALAATLADRVMFTVGAEPSRLAWAIGVARQARTTAGLDPAGLRMGAYLNVACDPDATAACDLVRGSAAIFAHFASMPGSPAIGSSSAGSSTTGSSTTGFGTTGFGTTGFSPPDAVTVREVGAAYDETRHGLSHAAHTAGLDDSFLTRFAVVGSPDQCLARLRQLIALGLDRVVVVPGSRDADPARLARSNARFARDVLPALREPHPAARNTNTPQPR
jgi:5,10-methylenetetrahydromethanopterin reductase